MVCGEVEEWNTVRYLTKEWFELCQRTGLHFGKRVHSGANIRDEALYKRLYSRKEKQYVKQEREIYDIDPRYMLKFDGTPLVPAGKFFRGEEIREEDTLVYQMPSEERREIEKLIADYDARPPFDESGCKQKFKDIQEWNCRDSIGQLPGGLIDQIADIRVFSLGYCTKEILQQLKQHSKSNQKQMQFIMNEYREVQQAEQIPEYLRDKFHFHDCRVTDIHFARNLVIQLDSRGEFTSLNHVTFVAPEIMQLDEHIVGSSWLYNELYRVDDGYEVHVLFAGKDMPELILRCKDIVIEER